MVKKFIAAALLVAMVAWAEMALAPMFVMQVWHVHPAREMPGHNAAHDHAMPAGLPCCPGVGKTEDAARLEFAASSLPCQDQHRCCFQQGPQSIPAPVSARVSQEISAAEMAELNPASDTQSHVSPAAAIAVGSPPSLSGMVFRV
jgi:hypothetical protein